MSLYSEHTLSFSLSNQNAILSFYNVLVKVWRIYLKCSNIPPQFSTYICIAGETFTRIFIYIIPDSQPRVTSDTTDYFHVLMEHISQWLISVFLLNPTLFIFLTSFVSADRGEATLISCSLCRYLVIYFHISISHAKRDQFVKCNEVRLENMSNCEVVN